MQADSFATNGFVVVPDLLSGVECDAIAAHLSRLEIRAAGSRCLLSQEWCRALARQLRRHKLLAAFVPSSFVATQCTFFEKSPSRNWLVAAHQDLSIPVADRVDDPALRGWSEKEGSIFVQAPVNLLHQLVAIRVHIDECTAADGALRVVAGSHLRGRIERDSVVGSSQVQTDVVCVIQRGGALVMRPLLVHASSKSTGTSKRRVLHFLFGPRLLPHRLAWQHAV